MKEKIWYRADNPVKNKVGVWKTIERVVHEGNGYDYIHWRGYKWVVWEPCGRWEIKYMLPN